MGAREIRWAMLAEERVCGQREALVADDEQSFLVGVPSLVETLLVLLGSGPWLGTLRRCELPVVGSCRSGLKRVLVLGGSEMVGCHDCCPWRCVSDRRGSVPVTVGGSFLCGLRFERLGSFGGH